MPGQTLSLTIATQLQKAGFTEAAEQMRNLQGQIDGTTKKTSALEDITKKFIGGFSVAAAFEFYRQAADEAGKAEEAQNRLQTSVENAGASWAKNRAQINATNQALADGSRYAKGDLDSALNILIQRTNSVSVAQANMQTVMGISVKTGRDLADVADQVGRAANGSIRDTQQLGKEFGITGEKAKDADYVLTQLAKKFGDAAAAEDGYAKKTANISKAWSDLKESFGNTFMPLTLLLEDALTRIVKSIGLSVTAITSLGKAVYLLGTGQYKEGIEAAKAANEAFGKSISVYWEKTIPDAIKSGGTKTTAAAHQLRDDLLQFTKDTEAEAAKILSEIGKTEVQKARDAGELQKAEIKKRSDFVILTAQDQARVLLAIDADTAAKESAVQAQKMKDMYGRYVSYAAAIGAATGNLVSGQEDAWKQILDVVIDSLTQELTAVLVTSQAEAIAKQVAAGGWYGFISGAAMAAGIAGVGAVAKAALHSGGGSSSIGSAANSYGGGGGSYTGAGSGAPTAAAAASEGPTTNIRIVVQGDMVNDPAFTDRLVRKITDAVENRKVRLVATQVGS